MQYFNSKHRSMWTLCDAVYCDMPATTQAIADVGGFMKEEEIKAFGPHIKNHTLTRNDDLCIIYEFQNVAVVTWRGSSNTENWISNFKFFKEKLPEGKTIHEGFYDSFCEFKKILDTKLVMLKSKSKVIVTGHSRGGALAVLCARHFMKNRDFKYLECIVYGCPHIGNKAFADEYELIVPHTISIHYQWDLVTELPPEAIGYYAVGNQYPIDTPWWHFFFRRITDHLRKSYRKFAQVPYKYDLPIVE